MGAEGTVTTFFCSVFLLRDVFVQCWTCSVCFGSVVEVGGKSQEEIALQFTIGDPVVVAEGELVNLQGRVLSIEGERVTILPRHEDLEVSYLFGRFCLVCSYSLTAGFLW